MTLNRYSRPVHSVFSLVGNDERAITDSLAWTLERCPTFRRNLLKRLVGQEVGGYDLTVSTQTYGKDAGFTDIEVSGSSDLHLVIEAKRGWVLPTLGQLRRYAGRLKRDGLPRGQSFLVSASECSSTYARLHLPDSVSGIPVRHISWREILDVSRRSKANASSHGEKAWIDQFTEYMKGVASMQDVLSNRVFVVSLSTEEIRKGSGYTWIDVVERDRSYFHPVGNTWPTSPPNYVAFRYHGRLQTIHHVEKYKVCNNLQKEDKRWPPTSKPHFVYTLGRPIRPPLDITLGNLFSSARVWCLIDTLLTGKYKTLKDARDASAKRVERAEVE